MAMYTTKPPEILNLHSEMVRKLGELFSLKGTQWHTILNQVKMTGLLPTADVDDVGTMGDLFIRLMNKKGTGITYGEYTNIRAILGSHNVVAEEIIDDCTTRIHEFYKYVPEFEPTEKCYTTKVGHPVIMKCRITKSKTAITNVQWKRKAKDSEIFTDIGIDNDLYTGGSLESPSLGITKTREEDNGAIYVCHATNAAGRGRSEEIQLIIQPEQEAVLEMLENIRRRVETKAEPFVKAFGRIKGSRLIFDLELDVRESSVEFAANNDFEDVRLLPGLLKHQIAYECDFNDRAINLRIVKGSIIVSFDITGATNPLHPSALALAERFTKGLKDSSIVLRDETGNPLEIQHDSIKITMTQALEAAADMNKPVVSIDQAAYCIETGDTAILTCRLLTSTPISSVTWFRINEDGTEHPIAIDNKKYFGGSAESPSLAIDDITTEDEGRYVCYAESKFGVGKSFSTSICIFSSGYTTPLAMTDKICYDAFLIYSSKDSDDAHDVLDKLEENKFKVCVHERDFVPGETILDNICLAIKNSRKHVAIISESNPNTGCYDYEIDQALFHSLVPRKQNTMILLVLGEATVPQKLKLNEAVYQTVPDWLDQLMCAVKEPISATKQEFPKKNDYRVISVSNIDPESPIPEALNEMKQNVKHLQNIRIAKQNADRLRYALDDSEEEMLSSMDALKKIFDVTGETTTVLIFWIFQSLLKDDICTDFLKSLLLSVNDKPGSPAIIPVLPGELEPPDFIKDISFLQVKQDGSETTKDFVTRFKEAIARTAFVKTKVGPLQTHFGTKTQTGFGIRLNTTIFRISEIEGVFQGDIKSPRYLGVSFTGDGKLLLLDADNRCLKKVTIMGRPIDKLPFEKMPNRLSQIDSDHVALIYRDTFEILIINTNTMTIEDTREIKDDKGSDTILKGITAIDRNYMIVTSRGNKCSLNIALVKGNKILEEITSDLDGNEFSMPRRLTKLDDNMVAVADENDRRLVLVRYDVESDPSLKVEFSQERWNKNLYNVRGLAADSRTVYAAACHGVNTFDIRERKLSEKPLIFFRSNVLHTRALALYSSSSTQRKYLAVSLAQQNEGEPVKDIVKVFDISA